MKTILQVLPELNTGGTEYDTFDTANFLANKGYKSLILSSGGTLVKQLNSEVIHIENKYIKSKNILFLIYNIFFIRNIIKKYKVDVVHSRSRAQSWACFFALKKFPNVKYITTFHGLYGMQNIFKKLYNSSMVRNDIIIAVSEFAKNYIIKYYPEVANKIIVVYSWVDIKNNVINQDYINKIKTTYNIEPNNKIIFLPGRLSESKGHQFWLSAMQKVHNNNIVCLTMGNIEPLRNKLEKWAQNNNFRHRLAFIPYTDQIFSLYSISDIVVCPSIKAESFGKTVVESCLTGIPTIATNLGPFKETIIDKKTGWLVENGNIDEFAKTIENVLHLTQDEKNQIAKNAKEHVLNNFSSDNLLLKILEIYEN